MAKTCRILLLALMVFCMFDTAGTAVTAGYQPWMDNITHARVTYTINISARYQRPDMAVISNHRSTITIDSDLVRASAPASDIIGYHSVKSTVSYSLSDSCKRTYSMPGGGKETKTETATGSGTFGNNKPHGDYLDFIELTIYPQWNIYGFTAYSRSGKIEVASSGSAGQSRQESTAQFNFAPTYYLDSAQAGGIKGSDSWSVKKYFSIANMAFASQRMQALNQATPKDGKFPKEMLEVAIKYPAVPSVGNSPSVVVLEDPSVEVKGTVTAEWVFTTGSSLPPVNSPQPPVAVSPYNKESASLLNEAADFADKMVEYYKNGNYNAMYEVMTQGLRAKMTLTDWESICLSQKSILGSLTKYRKANVYTDTGVQGVVDVDYYAEFSRMDGAITVSVSREGKDFKLKAFLVNSAALMSQGQDILKNAPAQ